MFFYNPSTRTSVWERPEDLLGRADVDKAIATTPEQLIGTQPPKEEKPQVDIVMDNSSSTAESATVIADALVRRHLESDSSADEAADGSAPKKAKLDVTGKCHAISFHERILLLFHRIAATLATKQPEKNKDIGKEAAIEAEVRAARERALVPLETRVTSFKEMLKEKDVSDS